MYEKKTKNKKEKWEVNIDRFTKALAEILSEKYGVDITIKAERRTGDGKQKVVLCGNTSDSKV